MTKSKDRPGVAEVKGQAYTETPRFMAPQTAGSGTLHC